MISGNNKKGVGGNSYERMTTSLLRSSPVKGRVRRGLMIGRAAFRCVYRIKGYEGNEKDPV